MLERHIKYRYTYYDSMMMMPHAALAMAFERRKFRACTSRAHSAYSHQHRPRRAGRFRARIMLLTADDFTKRLPVVIPCRALSLPQHATSISRRLKAITRTISITSMRDSHDFQKRFFQIIFPRHASAMQKHLMIII